MQTFEVDVCAIHQVDCTRLRQQCVENVDIVDISLGNPHENRNGTVDVEESVYLYRRLASSE